MATRYTITIQNMSGSMQNYALFGNINVNGQRENQIWPSILQTARAPHHGDVHFQFRTEYRAVAGMTNGPAKDRGEFTITDYRPVSLGNNGPGSTVALKTSDGGIHFDGGGLPNGARNNAFEIKTGNDFKPEDVRSNNYVIGVGLDQDQTLAIFSPSPGASYNIMPSKEYFIVVGNYDRDNLIEQNGAGMITRLDFSYLKPDVAIVHDQNGSLNIQQ